MTGSINSNYTNTEYVKQADCWDYLTVFIALNIVIGMWSENIVGDTWIWSKLAFSAQIAW